METKTILIKDTTILNPNSNNVREFNGSVLIENDKIVFLPYDEQSATCFINHGYKIIEPESFSINMLKI